MNLMQQSISALLVVATCAACGSRGFDSNAKNGVNNGTENNATTFNNGTNSANNGNVGNNSTANGTIFLPEIEEEYEFSAPAVVGSRVFVANETLNSVAVIESSTLEIKTIPVGFRPTEIVGPTTANGNVWVLNEGSHSVSLIDPVTLKSQTFPSLRDANSIRANADASWAFVWFDLDKVEDKVSPQVDLASVSAFSKDGQYRLATGFNVRDVQFTDDGKFALIFTDDGISKLELSTLSEDAIVPPIAILDADPNDLEILVDPTGTWAVGRADTFRGLVLVNLNSGETVRLDLPEIPTDIDWVAGGDILVSMPRTNLHFIATIPAGFSNLAQAIQDLEPADDVGMSDVGMDVGMSDAGDMGMPSDAGDMGADSGDAGAGDASSGDMNATVEIELPMVDGVTVLSLETKRLGAAEVDPSGKVVMFFSTLNEEKRAILYDIPTAKQSGVTFEKTILGAFANEGGSTFVAVHDKEAGVIPDGTTPIDPIYVARSWGISLVDVASGASRLILTPHRTGQSVLWSDAERTKLYFGFRIPEDEEKRVPSMKRIVVANLKSFATSSLSLASYPEGFGVVPSANLVFVSQIHEQGRLSFLNVETDQRQTVTGYQLNAGID